MKKNTMMRVASALLVAVLLSTCAISGTFAKYITTGGGSDFARVAKWGVEIKAESFDLFTDKYETDDTTFEGEYSVKSSDGKDVLAPGTNGTFADIAISGTPEVAVDVAIVATVNVSNNWIVDDKFYCPVTVTVGSTAISGLEYDSAAEFAGAIKEEIDGKSAQYEPNTSLGNTDLELSWAWAFEGAAGGKQTDVKDTALGDAAADGEELKIEIGVAITATQID